MGVDAGSTTIKIVLLNDSCDIVYKVYRRHQANIQETFTEELNKIIAQFPEAEFKVNITGSAGMGIAERSKVPFIQEVVAAVEVVNKIYPDSQTLIDLGGEDAKMVFFKKGKHPDIRMNGSCAGGTGAFIDQMASLMNIQTEELGELALNYEKTYPIASRCGVFAKTDVQNLISRNIPKADIAASILYAVALQTVTSLARGCEAVPKVLCIGGPLTFIPALRQAFKDVLKISEEDLILPDHGEYFPALGAALYDEKDSSFIRLQSLVESVVAYNQTQQDSLPPLFNEEEEYNEWKRKRKIKPLKFQKLGEKKRIYNNQSCNNGCRC